MHVCVGGGGRWFYLYTRHMDVTLRSHMIEMCFLIYEFLFFYYFYLFHIILFCRFSGHLKIYCFAVLNSSICEKIYNLFNKKYVSKLFSVVMINKTLWHEN